jgi:hypothetical protein
MTYVGLHIMVISLSALLRRKNVLTEKCREKIKTRFVFNNFFSSPDNRVIYKIIYTNVVESGRPQMAIWRMRAAC